MRVVGLLLLELLRGLLFLLPLLRLRLRLLLLWRMLLLFSVSIMLEGLLREGLMRAWGLSLTLADKPPCDVTVEGLTVTLRLMPLRITLPKVEPT